MLGFGSAKTVEISYGQFVCPHCQRTTTYKHKELARSKRIFFSLSVLGETISEYIECQICHERFSLDVLRSKLSPDVAQILDGLKAKLMSGIAIEEAEILLIDAGIDAPTVTRYVSVAAGIGLKRCPRCKLTFRDDVPKCHKCGHALPVERV